MRRETLLSVMLLLIGTLAATGQTTMPGRATTTRPSGGTTRAVVPRNRLGAERLADERGNASGALGGDKLMPSPSTPSIRVAGPLKPVAVAKGEPSLGSITKGSASLPNDGGQVWREYDLTPYTSKLTTVEKPQQAIIDWVLRDTGTDIWFGSPLGILSADKNTLRVYHTPQVQESVKGIYDRFMATSAAANRLSIRVATVSNPNWRSRAVALLKPIDVQSTGVDAWLATRDNAALLASELRKRADYRERAARIVDIPNGQTYPLGLTQQRQFIRSIRPKADGTAGYEAETANVSEGYSLEISPLASVDGKSLDAIVKCNIDQIEKLIDVPVDIPMPLGQSQRMSIQVPQIVSWRLHERFRWPSDHVLILSCGVVATPTAEKAAMPLLGPLVASNRADALLIIEPVSAAAPLPPVAAASLPGLPALTAPPPSVPTTASPFRPRSPNRR
jgi:hypothetical protein